MILSFNPSEVINSSWAVSGARLPTPLYLGKNIYRVYFAARCPDNFSRIGYLDLHFEGDGASVHAYSKYPSLGCGAPGRSTTWFTPICSITARRQNFIVLHRLA